MNIEPAAAEDLENQEKEGKDAVAVTMTVKRWRNKNISEFPSVFKYALGRRKKIRMERN
jgi:hypothetical protein